MAKIIITFLLLLAVAVNSASAQTATLYKISGKVTFSDGRPLKGVLVASNFDKSDVTNSSGEYEITGLAPGLNYTLSFRKYGYSFAPQVSTGTVTQDIIIPVIASVFQVDVRGLITKSGLPMAGIVLDAGALGTATTDANGIYKFAQIPFGTKISITPQTTSNLSFSPKVVKVTLRSNREIDFLALESVASKPNACSDGVDNDGDGFTDFPADIGCANASDSTETRSGGPQCDDGKDNDGDGLVDRKDSDCSSNSDITEGVTQPAPTCSSTDISYKLNLFDDKFEVYANASSNAMAAIAKRLAKASKNDATSINRTLANLRSSAEQFKGQVSANIGILPAQVLTCPARRRCKTDSLTSETLALKSAVTKMQSSNNGILKAYDRIAAKKLPKLRKSIKNTGDSLNSQAQALIDSLKVFPKQTSVCGQ